MLTHCPLQLTFSELECITRAQQKRLKVGDSERAGAVHPTVLLLKIQTKKTCNLKWPLRDVPADSRQLIKEMNSA
jgi:hypothetical protein